MSAYNQQGQYQQTMHQQQHYPQHAQSLNVNYQPPQTQQPQQNVNSSSLVHSDQSGTTVYLALLALADQFQQSKNYRLCIHCMESILTLKPQEAPIVRNFHVQLKTRLSLCRLYLRHTVNTNPYVNIHLEKAILLIKNVNNKPNFDICFDFIMILKSNIFKLNANDEFKYEATFIIYKIFHKQKEIHNQVNYEFSVKY
jgi:hypothetical protein